MHDLALLIWTHGSSKTAPQRALLDQTSLLERTDKRSERQQLSQALQLLGDQLGEIWHRLGAQERRRDRQDVQGGGPIPALDGANQQLQQAGTAQVVG